MRERESENIFENTQSASKGKKNYFSFSTAKFKSVCVLGLTALSPVLVDFTSRYRSDVLHQGEEKIIFNNFLPFSVWKGK